MNGTQLIPGEKIELEHGDFIELCESYCFRFSIARKYLQKQPHLLQV